MESLNNFIELAVSEGIAARKPETRTKQIGAQVEHLKNCARELFEGLDILQKYKGLGVALEVEEWISGSNVETLKVKTSIEGEVKNQQGYPYAAPFVITINKNGMALEAVARSGIEGRDPEPLEFKGLENDEDRAFAARKILKKLAYRAGMTGAIAELNKR